MTAPALGVRCSGCGVDAELDDYCLPCAYQLPAATWTDRFTNQPHEAYTGAVEPRIWTRSLRDLTPQTSLGFECIAFATIVLGMRLDPWQAWFLVHAMEIRPDGRFRFRTVLLLVARQNGKTSVMRALTLWAMFTGRVKLAIGTAQDLDVARECWTSAVDLVEEDEELSSEIAGRFRRAVRSNGKEELKLRNGARYKIKATTVDAGRGIPGVGLLLADELRTHTDYKAWGALSKTTMAVPNALIVGMSNAGDDTSVVLNQLRDLAMAGTSASLAIFEWSAEKDCAVDDPAAWAQANPSLGYGRLTFEALTNAVETDPVAVFRTECLCQRVSSLDDAINADGWEAGSDPAVTIGPGLDETDEAYAVRRAGMRITTCFDVSLDGGHATLLRAAPAGASRTRVEVVRAWTDMRLARQELPELLSKIKPERFGWFPSGPGQAIIPGLLPIINPPRRKGSRRRPHLEIVELTGSDVSASCMGFADLVKAGMIVHGEDELLNAQVAGAAKVAAADGWRLTRKGLAHVDAVYAAAGAVHVLVTNAAPRRTGGSESHVGESSPAEETAP